MIIISAFIPFIANECWEKLTGKDNLSAQNWPKISTLIKKQETCNVVIQINGKKRAIVNVMNDEEESQIFSKSLAINNIKVILDGKTIKNKIFVKNKILNIVTNEN